MKLCRRHVPGRLKRRLEGNNKRDFGDMCCENVKRIELAQDHICWWAFGVNSIGCSGLSIRELVPPHNTTPWYSIFLYCKSVNFTAVRL
jgi:hypothetical protein